MTIGLLPFERRPAWRAHLAVVSALAVGLVMALAPAAAAAPGDLDTGFGTGGKVTTDFGASPSEPEIGNDLLRTSNGSLFVTGRRGFNPPGTGLNSTFGIAKYTAGGALDTGFGTGGKVATSFGDTVAVARTIIEAGSGKLLVGGFTKGEQIADLALARYNSDGSLDTSFGGGDGKVTTDVSGGLGDGIRGLSLTSGGKILAAGAAGADSFIARYNSDGTLDTGFGGGDGIVTTDFGTGDHLFALEELSSGKMIAAGSANSDFLLVRYNSDGTLDTGFGGGDGIVTTDFNGFSDLAFGFTQAPGGDYVIAGAVDAPEPFGVTGPIKVGVVRYNSDGSLDTGFSGDGKVTTDVNTLLADEARDVAVDGNGKIVIAGVTGESVVFPVDPVDGDVLVARYNSDGSLDTGFSGDGIATVDFSGGADAARGIALTGSNDIVIAGGATSSTTGLDFALAKLQG
ncbi:hypothetical protein DI272_20030 [Streptomyces sp. Act143]|uniref:hypothetical protein n=1 Tax=Streptomyces sp. Act143 TaxID=2200760 RepID=UPI000D6826A3|nr:hypothetical protein [Streptomyces sp. Act143]PWI16199.1 hypothetical protein DI272_20030 [Streptomyces sp. Act143]